MSEKFTKLAWNLLYNEDFEQILDPNKPENTARMNADQRAENEKLRVFVEGPGKVLIDKWKKQIKSDMLSLLAMPEQKTQCHCYACQIIQRVRNKFELLLEAEYIINK